MQDRGLIALFAYLRTFKSTILFPFMPSYPEIYWTVNVFSFFASHNFASLQNLMNINWLDPFEIFLHFLLSLNYQGICKLLVYIMLLETPT